MATDSEALDPNLFGPEQPCFGCSPTHPTGFRLRFSREGEGDTAAVRTEFVPGEHHQGPPGVMHGGLVLTLADEIAAWTIIGLRERFGFTGAVDARLLRPVRVGVTLHGRGTILRESARVMRIAVSLTQSGDEVFRGEFSFALLDAEGAERLMGAGLPDAWRRFAR